MARTLDEALRRQVVVVIEQCDDPVGRRSVEPLAIGRDEGRWWLFAWCRRDRRGRPFPLDRITGAWLTTEAAPARDVHEVFDDIPGDASALSLPPTGPAG